MRPCSLPRGHQASLLSDVWDKQELSDRDRLIGRNVRMPSSRAIFRRHAEIGNEIVRVLPRLIFQLL